MLYEYKDKQGRPSALLSDEVANFVMAHAAELDAERTKLGDAFGLERIVQDGLGDQAAHGARHGSCS